MYAGTGTESRALELLGSGLPPETVAAAVGVTVSRISQLLSDETFAAEVAELRYKNLANHNARDSSYDGLEDKLLEKMKDLIPFMMKPSEILRAIQVINGAKRRGQSTPESIVNQQTVVQLLMPTQIMQKFTTNINNVVVQAGEQELVTMQTGVLLNKLKAKALEKEGEQSGTSSVQTRALN